MGAFGAKEDGKKMGEGVHLPRDAGEGTIKLRVASNDVGVIGVVDRDLSILCKLSKSRLKLLFEVYVKFSF